MKDLVDLGELLLGKLVPSFLKLLLEVLEDAVDEVLVGVEERVLHFYLLEPKFRRDISLVLLLQCGAWRLLFSKLHKVLI